jgi:diaminohydroxyphosphoribosylaminopyrimidine deaminase / 5-amino-6-(5-phosphoribosylamino)uracil reductase
VSDSSSDERFMAAALALGRRGLGVAAPNPAVGALIVRDGIVVGRGVTARGGRPHAERLAIDEAGAAARGATLYVTLEPCAHQGRAGPCADAIIEVGLARVVSAIDDPDPRMAGRGHARLQEAGVEVRVGVGAEEAHRAHVGHRLRVEAGRPAVTLKLAQTADGYAAGARYDPRLAITGEAANGQVQIMRGMHEAIMIGIGTALIDDPLLTVRYPGASAKPLRVVLDVRLQLSPRSRLAATARDFPTLALAGSPFEARRADALTEAGVEIDVVDTDHEGRIDLLAALRLLAARGVTRVFSEGGPRVGSALIARGLADEVVLLTGPKPLGRRGLPALDGGSRAALEDRGLFKVPLLSYLGADAMRRYVRIF